MKYYKSVHNMKDNGILYEVGETYQYIGDNPHQSLLWFVTTPWMSLGKRPYASKHHNLLRVEPVGNIFGEYPFFRTDQLKIIEVIPKDEAHKLLQIEVNDEGIPIRRITDDGEIEIMVENDQRVISNLCPNRNIKYYISERDKAKGFLGMCTYFFDDQDNLIKTLFPNGSSQNVHYNEDGSIDLKSDEYIRVGDIT